ncbi:MAG: hypothetical protein HOP16_12220 [Acidobacteria bacterium]|nr:hypothetical protein [Acidobacteriota bacterium]
MLKLLERNIATVEQRLVLVAPPHAKIPNLFSRVTVDSAKHRQLVGEMQAMRGGVYLQGGYLTPEQLSAGGRHQTPEDEKSWHLLITDADGRVSSCGWYLNHENTVSVDGLRVRNCPLARNPEWRDKLYAAVESDIARARRAGVYYAELGGWAVSKDRRCSSEGLMLALAGYGLSRLLGDAIGMTAANVTHASSSILRRLGGSFLETGGTTIPAYFDPSYNTMIELLRFDSRRPSVKFNGLIDLAKTSLTKVTVVARSQGTWQPSRVRMPLEAEVGPLVAA